MSVLFHEKKGGGTLSPYIQGKINKNTLEKWHIEIKNRRVFIFFRKNNGLFLTEFISVKIYTLYVYSIDPPIKLNKIACTAM